MRKGKKLRWHFSPKVLNQANRLNAVFGLRLHDGLSYPEIAKKVGVSVSQISLDVAALKESVGEKKRKEFEIVKSQHETSDYRRKRLKGVRQRFSREKQIEWARNSSVAQGVGPEKIAKVLKLLNAGLSYEQIGRVDGLVSATSARYIDQNRERYAEIAGIPNTGKPRSKAKKKEAQRIAVGAHPKWIKEFALNEIKRGITPYGISIGLIENRGIVVHPLTVRGWAIKAGLYEPGKARLPRKKHELFSITEKNRVLEKYAKKINSTANSLAKRYAFVESSDLVSEAIIHLFNELDYSSSKEPSIAWINTIARQTMMGFIFKEAKRRLGAIELPEER